MKFSELAKLFETLEKTKSYNEMRTILSKFFKKTPKNELEQTVYLTLGRISSQYAGIKLGMAAKMVLRAIGKKATSQYKKLGDIGKTAEQHSQGKGKLNVKQVYDTLHKIATTSGTGSQEKKVDLLKGLFSKATPIEARYIARLVIGDLRLGIGDKAVLDSLAMAYTGTKTARKELEHAYTMNPDAGAIAKMIANKGVKGVKTISMTIGVPIQSMLCQRIKVLDEVKKRTGYPVAVEEKYDGERIQIHKKNKNVKLFSRRLEDITTQYPDVVAEVQKTIKLKECILDSEAMPVDPKGNFLPFQTLMQRRRKHDIEGYAKKIPVTVFLFDILYDGKPLLKEPYARRYAKLQKAFKQTNKIKLALHKICNNIACIEEIFNKTIDLGGEGVVIKDLNGTYQAGTRDWNWIKWKPEYVKGLRDTYDLVIIGAYHGKGRRAGKYGALLCAIYDSRKDKFETICKVGSGLTDKTLTEIKKKLKTVIKKPARVEIKKIMTPDVWVAPEFVIEVIGAEITKSPSHTSGYALRFPRFLRWRDKKPEQATTTKEIKP